MNKIKYKNVKEFSIKKEQDRNCFLYGICSDKSAAPESHKITQFGLAACNLDTQMSDNSLAISKGEVMKKEEKKLEDNSINEKACSVYGRCTEDPFNDLLNSLTQFGLKVVNENK